jgi:hypothetical protein
VQFYAAITLEEVKAAVREFLPFGGASCTWQVIGVSGGGAEDGAAVDP